MKEIESEGKTVQEAIDKGLKELGVSRDDVDVKILSEGKTGLFGLMGASPAKVKIASKDTIQSSAPKSKPGERTPAEVSDVAVGKVVTELKKILKLMGIKSEIKTSIEDDYIHADIVTEDSALLIGRKGQTLNALEIITNMVLNKKDAETRIRATVDTAGYRIRRKKALEHIAVKTAQDVAKNGMNIELEPMNASERRTIHMILKDDPHVQTNSDGRGSFRKVIVSPKSPDNTNEA